MLKILNSAIKILYCTVSTVINLSVFTVKAQTLKSATMKKEKFWKIQKRITLVDICHFRATNLAQAPLQS